MQVKRTGQAEYGLYIKALLCGEPGSGKTLLSSTFPNPIYASAEAGLMSVADRGIPYVEITSSTELLQMRMGLTQPPDVREKMFDAPVDTVIIDTIDEVQRILIRERLEAEKKDKLSLPDFGWLGGQMEAIIRGFRNLDMNVIFTCHVKETRDDEMGKIVYKPQLQGAICDQITGMVDLALVLQSRSINQIDGKENRRVTKRFAQTFPDSQHPWVKDRSGKLPDEVELTFDDDFDRIHTAIYGGKSGKSV